MDDEELGYLAEFIRIRNAADQSVAKIIGRPAHVGHIAEFIASRIFDIELHQAATFKASDGYFRSGTLTGMSVNIKYVSRSGGILDLARSSNPGDHADIYLVLAGPNSGAVSSKNTAAPWVISNVYMFESSPLVEYLVSRGRVPGIATSIVKRLWDRARIYPDDNSEVYELSEVQRSLLKLFAPIPTLPN